MKSRPFLEKALFNQLFSSVAVEIPSIFNCYPYSFSFFHPRGGGGPDEADMRQRSPSVVEERPLVFWTSWCVRHMVAVLRLRRLAANVFCTVF